MFISLRYLLTERFALIQLNVSIRLSFITEHMYTHFTLMEMDVYI